MNNSNTPKIVVGVGLVAAYAAGLTFLTLRDAPETAVTPSEQSALSAQMVTAPALPPMGTPEAAAAMALSPEASAAVEAPVPSAPVVASAKAPATARPAAPESKPRVEEVPVASLPSPRPPVASEPEDLDRSNTGSNAVSELAATSEGGSGESVTSTEEVPTSQDSEGTDEAPAAAIGN